MDGTAVGKPDQFDAGYGSLSYLEVDVPAATHTSGLLYLDEVYCTDPAADVGAALVGTFSAKIPGTIIGIGNAALLSNVSLRQDLSLATAGFSTLYGIPLQTSDVSSRTHVDANIAATQTSIDLIVHDEGGAASISGGHKVTFPSFGSPLSVTDVFFPDRCRRFLAGGQFEPDGRLGPGAVGGCRRQRRHGRRGRLWPSHADLAGGAELQSAGTSPPRPLISSFHSPWTSIPSSTDWYGARWAQGSCAPLPWESGSDIQRTEKLGFHRPACPGRALGFNFAASADASGIQLHERGLQPADRRVHGGVDAREAGAGRSSPDSLSLSYKRSLSLVSAPSSGPRFQAETDELARILGLQGYFLAGVPVAEIFTDNTPVVIPAWASASQATYIPSLNLSLQRSYGSRLIDLFLPSSIDLDIGQELDKTNDLAQTVAYIRPRTTVRAVNLFGALGAYPFLTGVKTDEYSLSFSGSLEGAPGTDPCSPWSPSMGMRP